MRTVPLLAFAAVAVLASCRDVQDTTAPSLRGLGPLRDVSGMNCDMDPTKCSKIRAGIDYLLNHANESCRVAGQAALDRFEAPASAGNGYVEAAQVSNFVLGTPMAPGSSTSGYVATSGYIQVYPLLWSSGTDQPNQMGAYLAHEEQHENGMENPQHTMGVAQAYYNVCLNPAA